MDEILKLNEIQAPQTADELLKLAKSVAGEGSLADSKAESMHTDLDTLEKNLEEMKEALLKALSPVTEYSEYNLLKDREKELDLSCINDLQEEVRQMHEKLDSLDLDEIASKLDLIEEMDEDVKYMKDLLNEKLNIDFEAMYNNVLEQMNVEAIKIYRNVQAVVVEEDAKQNHVLFTVDGKADKLKFRMNHVLVFSIVSFVVSILVMLITILPALGVKLF